jgi:hypothetical protein
MVVHRPTWGRSIGHPVPYEPYFSRTDSPTPSDLCLHSAPPLPSPLPQMSMSISVKDSRTAKPPLIPPHHLGDAVDFHEQRIIVVPLTDARLP